MNFTILLPTIQCMADNKRMAPKEKSKYEKHFDINGDKAVCKRALGKTFENFIKEQESIERSS